MPPVLASALCTIVWQAISGNSIIDRPTIGFGLASLFFTIAGSAMLMLVFSSMSSRSLALRYLCLAFFGAVAGGGVMLVLSNSSKFVAAGAVYGVVTAALWAMTHSLIYRRS